MNYKKILIPIGVAVLFYAGWSSSQWMGVAFVGSGLVMWALLYITRMIKTMLRAANRPVGFVDSAVMLNAKLKAGDNLMHVIAMTRSLGKLQTPFHEQPEVFTWTDGTQSVVTCTFVDGLLKEWQLVRPTPEPDGTSSETQQVSLGS
ncbi:MAG: glycerate kinase [Betaproteobacteria bacterium]|jgi:hypothetical protein|nr:glycerate kinase [Betaproteobacteria bacterium]NBT67195.1 glycerate kinase [Betaproteobacteria bacterium]NBY07477.1 glycerate kinase [Betaproteobacteria bacterium]